MRSWKKNQIYPRWRSFAEFERPATGEARPLCMPWWPLCGRKEIKPLVRFEGLPGEFSQHDFGQVDVEFLDGATRRIHFFASRLKYSRYIRVSVVKDETVESLVRNLAEHLDSWGGVPLLCVFDRPKTVALKWRRNGEVTEWNPVFAYAMLEMGIGVELCWPHSPEQKGTVENLVGFVKSSFFKVRRFQDQEDLQQQLVGWHREVNEERPCRATGIIPAVRLAEEASRLRPLKVHPKIWLFASLSMWARRAPSCMRGILTPCLRKRSACRGRCICMPVGCAS